MTVRKKTRGLTLSMSCLTVLPHAMALILILFCAGTARAADSFTNSIPNATDWTTNTLPPQPLTASSGWLSVPTEKTIWLYDDTNSISADQAHVLREANIYVVRNAKMVLQGTRKKKPYSLRHPVVYRRWVTFRTEFAPVLFGAAGVGVQSVTAVKVK